MDLLISAKTALLAALVSGPGFGLELIERVLKCSGGRVALNQGSAYPALRALEREGMVKSYEGEANAERGGRPRIYYEITGKGRRAAMQQREAIVGLWQLAGAES